MKSPRMRSIVFSFLLCIPLLLVTVELQAYSGIKVESLKQNDNSQSLILTFWLDATPDCVLGVLLDYRHVALISGTVDSIKLVTSTDDMQIVRYRYDGFFYNYDAVYHRWPDREKGEIRYELINYKQSGIPVPLLTNSSGLYKVNAKSSGTQVMLSQKIGIEQSILSSHYLSHAYHETINFTENLIQHIQARCKTKIVKEVILKRVPKK